MRAHEMYQVPFLSHFFPASEEALSCLCLLTSTLAVLLILILIAFILGFTLLCIPTVSSFQDNILFVFK